MPLLNFVPNNFARFENLVTPLNTLAELLAEFPDDLDVTVKITRDKEVIINIGSGLDVVQVYPDIESGIIGISHGLSFLGMDQ